MHLADLLRPADVVIGLRAADIGTAADLLLHHVLGGHGFSAEEVERLVAAVLAREKEAPTLCGPIAIPHAREAQLASFVAAVGVNPDGVTEATPSPRIMIAILSPETQRSEHLALLASLARLSRERNTIDAIVHAKTGEEVVRIVAGVK